ncbi:MAG TPA: hypothetical protein VMW42_07185 [Desulfatiglandales bacterium]|nr:hypothetical protein [Desulfatiglandales bacterium]
MSLLTLESVTLTRKAAGSYVNGHYVDGAVASSTIEANVQPLTGKEILQLAEADRNRESLKAFSTSEIRVNDIITRSSKTYEVQKVADYAVQSIPHYEAVMLLIEGQ